MPIGPPGLNQNQPPQGPRGPQGPQAGKDEKPGQVQQPKVAEADGASSKPQPKNGAKSSPAAAGKQAPPPPVDSKPDVSAALAPPHPQNGQPPAKGAPSGPKGGRIIPAVPIPSPRATKAAPQAQQGAGPSAAPAQMPTAAQQQNATQLATAAVAEAMAKLNLQNKGQAPGQPQGQPPVSDPMNNLAQQVQGMREQQSRQHQPRQRGTGEFRGRGGRGGRGGAHPQHPKMEVPTTDFDFESSNAKFNKQDLVKEAIASGSPMGDAPAVTAGEASTEKEEVVIPGGSMYDKSSFFDNISSELKDREEAAMRGQEFRSQERQKNMETFGQGSVDGYRGRGRGRGRGGRGGRGLGYRGRGAPRGRGGAEFSAQPAA